MGFDSDDEDMSVITKNILKHVKDDVVEYENDIINHNSSGKSLEEYKIYEYCCDKKHLKEYNYLEIIELKDFPNPFYFSRTRVLILLDDILCVDVMCYGDYYPYTNDLKYILGSDDRELLSRANDRCREILSSGFESFKFESTKVYKILTGKKLTRLYLKDFDYLEEVSTVNFLSQEILQNKMLCKADLKIRGRHSGFIERSLGCASVENTYIQLIADDVNFFLNECIGLLEELKKYLI